MFSCSVERRGRTEAKSLDCHPDGFSLHRDIILPSLVLMDKPSCFEPSHLSQPDIFHENTFCHILYVSYAGMREFKIQQRENNLEIQ